MMLGVGVSPRTKREKVEPRSGGTACEKVLEAVGAMR
jgi:hypothetical protein